MNLQKAKQSLDKVINKSRIHFYKPIQVAEILYRDRIVKDINLADLETYRNASKKWRDIICLQFLGRTSTSSARYQDDIFNENAISPGTLELLGKENRQKNGIVEAYIYRRFAEQFSQMKDALNYCTRCDKSNFQLSEFIMLFSKKAGLKRSIDKIYEIVVYAIFAAIIEAVELSIDISYNPERIAIVTEFQDFAIDILNLSHTYNHFQTKARIYRVGTTNASDRGLDMWANFGIAVQIKHLSLNEALADTIVHSITADRIVIVCKSAEQKVITSLLNQIGWKSKIQAVITETKLLNWYEKALRGKHSDLLGEKVLEILNHEIKTEFPATENQEFEMFFRSRKYNELTDVVWQTRDYINT